MRTPWLRKAEETFYPPLQEDIEADVCVIGGGITGITTAYLLQEEGRRVVLVERMKLAEGASGHTSGHLTSLVDAYYHNVIRDFSEEKARQLYSATVESRQMLEIIIADNALDAGYERVPAYYYSTDDKQDRLLQKERKALQQLGLNIRDVDLSEFPIRVKSAFKVEDQGVINAALYIRGLARVFVNNGGRIYEQTSVMDFKTHDEYVEVLTPDNAIKARYMVQATHTPLKINPLQMEMKNYNSYVLAGESIHKVKKGIFYDFAEPYNYIRHYEEDGELMYVVGGFDTKSGTKNDERDRMDELSAYASKNFGVGKVEYSWSNMLFTSPDGLPFIGKDPVHKNCFLATGFAGDGLTYGLVSAMINTALITKGDHPWKNLFNPSRISLSAVQDLVVKGADTVQHFIFDRFHLDGKEVEELIPDSGTVLEVNGKRLGVYVDKDRKVFVVDAACSHMKCIVQWNAVAKTWDCGCHGSRFDKYGNVVAGPATRPLLRDHHQTKVK